MDEKLPIVKEENGIVYILSDGRYLQNVVRPTGYRLAVPGGYMRARAEFLLNHRRDIFLRLQEKRKLSQHLGEIRKEAYELRETIMKQMLKKNPIPESLKSTDQLKWVGLMENYRSSAEEIVRRDVIYPEGLLEELEEWGMDNMPTIEVEEVFRELTPEEILEQHLKIQAAIAEACPDLVDESKKVEDDWDKF